MVIQENQITVTSPLLPPLEDFVPLLEDIWSRKWITNNGYYHQQLEKSLSEYLDVPYISLFTNGTIPLLTALQALDIKGEVITTPYSFVATSNAAIWNDVEPVFVDIDEKTGNLDPNKIEDAITANTQAILPVHVYGNPCDTEAIQSIAEKHNLKMIYDAAHAFGVKKNGKTILSEGDISTLSFHATKTYNTVEGGALICKNEKTKAYIDSLKNFGYTSEIYITETGINGKMDEIRSAYGLLNLKNIDTAIEKRKHVATLYRNALKDIEGLTMFKEDESVTYNYSYFPIFIDNEKFQTTRDDLFINLRANGILSRRYFYPLISNFKPYQHIPSASRKNLPVANKMADSVLCLPIHHLLSDADVARIVSFIANPNGGGILMYTPIVIPTLCRSEHFKNLVESLKKCKESSETELFVGLDFPPAQKYEEGYNEIVEYLKTLTGFKAVSVIKRSENIGAIQNIKDLLATVCKDYDRFIFTEDDNIFAPAFLEYVNKGLDYFEGDKSIESISGFSYPVKMPESSTTVIKMQRYFSDWGFGTWRNRYFEARDTLTNEFFQKLYKSKALAKKLRKASKKNYTRAFGFMSEENVRPYDYTNSCGQILLDRYSIMPKKTLVKNTGWDNTGVHCDEASPIAKLFMAQELDTSEHFGDFIFDEKESEELNKIVDKSLIGAYDKIPYCKTRLKEVLYRHGMYSVEHKIL